MTAEQTTNLEPTWAALLAQCVEFARSAVSLPDDGEAGRYKRSVSAVITLHAVTHALGQLERLGDDEIPLALDRAEIQIREAAVELETVWDDEIPEALIPFLEDAFTALEACLAPPTGVEWFVTADSAEFGHPGELAAALASLGIRIGVHLPSPGVPMFRGSVAAHVELSEALSDEDADDQGGSPALVAIALVADFLGDAVGEPSPAAELRQVYRQFDFAKGGPVRDVVMPASSGSPAGQPLLVPVLLPKAKGVEIQPVPMPHRKSVPMEPVPVEFVEG